MKLNNIILIILALIILALIILALIILIVITVLLTLRENELNYEEDNVTGIEETRNATYLNGTQFKTKECSVDSTVGGPEVYSLRITFQDSSKPNPFNIISFGIEDPENNKSNLLTIGPHPATGKHWDSISNNLRSDSYSIIVKPDEMEIVWENIEVIGNKFNGEGYINIKKTILPICPETVWVGGHYANKGDPDYICNYLDYYPIQKIFFKCVNSSTF